MGSSQSNKGATRRLMLIVVSSFCVPAALAQAPVASEREDPDVTMQIIVDPEANQPDEIVRKIPPPKPRRSGNAADGRTKDLADPRRSSGNDGPGSAVDPVAPDPTPMPDPIAPLDPGGPSDPGGPGSAPTPREAPPAPDPAGPPNQPPQNEPRGPKPGRPDPPGHQPRSPPGPPGDPRGRPRDPGDSPRGPPNDSPRGPPREPREPRPPREPRDPRSRP